MVALVISAILIGALYSAYITQARTFTVQDKVVGLQQDARSAFAVLTRDIRMAGYLTGPGSASGFTHLNEGTYTAVNGFTYAVTPVNSNSAPDAITVIAAESYLGELAAVPSGTTLTFAEGIPERVRANDFVVFDMHTGTTGGVLYQSTEDKDRGATSLNVTALPTDPVERERVYAVTTVTYDVVNGVLRRNVYNAAGAQPLAGDGLTTVVEDLQFVYELEGGTEVSAPDNPAQIEAVKIYLVVRSCVPDPGEIRFFKPACGDRGQEDSFTGCRRRMYSTKVKVRNL